MTRRRPLTTLQRAAFFLDRGGRCEECECKLDSKGWEIDHRVALVMGGDNDPSNLRLLCRSCHKSKTRRDKLDAAKSDRIRAFHIGAKRSRNPLPGGRNSPWKKKLNGQVVPR